VRSDLSLRLLALVIAMALLLVVHGEKSTTVTWELPLAVALPAGVEPAQPLPEAVSVSISGPWATLRSLRPEALGAVPVVLTRTGPGFSAWYTRPEALHLPRGLRIDAVHPAQGSVELRRGPSVEPSSIHP
jgi:hypothetical protein